MGLRPGWDSKKPGKKLAGVAEYEDFSQGRIRHTTKRFQSLVGARGGLKPNPWGDIPRSRAPIHPPTREEYDFSDNFIAQAVGLRPLEVEEIEDVEMRKPFEPLLVGKGDQKA